MSDARETDAPGPIELPTLHSAELDRATLAQLFDDIERECVVLAVLVKGGAETLAEGGGVSLSRARELVESRAVRGVQLRYQHQGVEWWDTLMVLGPTVKLLRTRAIGE
jgi:hypothetical protein